MNPIGWEVSTDMRLGSAPELSSSASDRGSFFLEPMIRLRKETPFLKRNHKVTWETVSLVVITGLPLNMVAGSPAKHEPPEV